MRSKLTVLFVLLVVLVSCSRHVAEGVSLYPPEGFQEEDLIGSWITVNELYTSESIELAQYHTFSQTYQEIESGYTFSTTGTWELTVDMKTGCTYISLFGMRYFYQDSITAENGNKFTDGTPMQYWDPCGNASVQMADKTILVVASHPDSENGIVLWHMNIQEDANVVFEYDGK